MGKEKFIFYFTLLLFFVLFGFISLFVCENRSGQYKTYYRKCVFESGEYAEGNSNLSSKLSASKNYQNIISKTKSVVSLKSELGKDCVLIEYFSLDD